MNQIEEYLKVWYIITNKRKILEQSIEKLLIKNKKFVSYKIQNKIYNAISRFYCDMINAKNEANVLKMLYESCLTDFYVDKLIMDIVYLFGFEKYVITIIIQKFLSNDNDIIKIDKMDDFNYKFNDNITLTIPINKELIMINKNNYIITYLLYDCIDLNLYSWSIKSNTLEYVLNDYGVDVESYSSSFNRYTDKPFCSLFPEFEDVFGSIGNFFDIKYEQLPYVTYFVNPPYTEYMINMTIDKIINILDDLEDRKLTFIIVLPIWTDASYYEYLEKSKYVKERITLSNEEYLYKDNKTGKLISSCIAKKEIIVMYN